MCEPDLGDPGGSNDNSEDEVFVNKQQATSVPSNGNKKLSLDNISKPDPSKVSDPQRRVSLTTPMGLKAYDMEQNLTVKVIYIKKLFHNYITREFNFILTLSIHFV